MSNSISREDLISFQEKAKALEINNKQWGTLNQIREISEEAARSYFILSNYLMLKGQSDRQQLVELIKKFVKIENEAVMRFNNYKAASSPVQFDLQ